MTAIKAILGTLAVLAACFLLFVYSGIYNIGADEPHNKAVRWVLETVRKQSVGARAGELTVPADLGSEQRVRHGASSYAEMCQSCHLAPDMKPTPVHEGLNPKPPRLAEAASHLPPDRLFWIVKHGIKMTGMPAWGKTHDDQELWNVVAFVDKLPQMTPQQYKELTAPSGSSGH